MKVTFAGNIVTLSGDQKKIGDIAPDFTALDRELQERSLSQFKDGYIVISVVPSVDTGVCDFQTKKFNQIVQDMENVKVLTISNDLPFAQKRWCANAGMEDVITLSDHRDLDFAHKYGVLINEHRLLARSVFVLDPNREIIHLEYVSEVTDHPNYEKVIDLLSRG